MKFFNKLALFGAAIGLVFGGGLAAVKDSSRAMKAADAATTYTTHYDVLEDSLLSFYYAGDNSTIFSSGMQGTSTLDIQSLYFSNITDEPVSVTTKQDTNGHAYYFRLRAYLHLPALTYTVWNPTFSVSFVRTGSTSSSAYTISEVFVLEKDDSGKYVNPEKFNTAGNDTKSPGAICRTYTTGSTKQTTSFSQTGVIMANRTSSEANINLELGVLLYVGYDASNATGGTFTLTNTTNVQMETGDLEWKLYSKETGTRYYSRRESAEMAEAFNATSGQTLTFLKSINTIWKALPAFTQDGNIVFANSAAYAGAITINGATIKISGTGEISSKSNSCPLLILGNSTVTVTGSITFNATSTASNTDIAAVRVKDSTATFTGSTFLSSCKYSTAGAVEVFNSTVGLSDCTITANASRCVSTDTSGNSTITIHGGSLTTNKTGTYAYGIYLAHPTDKLYIYGAVTFGEGKSSYIYCTKECVYLYNSAKTINYSGSIITLCLSDNISLNSSTPMVLIAYANSSSVVEKVILKDMNSGYVLSYSASLGGVVVEGKAYRVTVNVTNCTYSASVLQVQIGYNCYIYITPDTGYSFTQACVSVENAYFYVTNNKITVYSATADVTVTVNATPITRYAVFYNNNTSATGTMDNISSYIDQIITIPECEYELENHTFVSWNTSEDGTGDTYYPGDKFTMSNANAYFYAIWVNSDLLAVRTFVDTKMHMSENVANQCVSYYAPAKSAYNALTSVQKALFTSEVEFADAYARLAAWASANGDVFADNNIVAAHSKTVEALSNNNLLIVVSLIAFISLAALDILLVYRRKRRA